MYQKGQVLVYLSVRKQQHHHSQQIIFPFPLLLMLTLISMMLDSIHGQVMENNILCWIL